jgi:glycosyltransferase involved in cell wall biosynthesis
MFRGARVSLVFPAYNEEENIENAIKDFKSIKSIDEIIVVDNNSKDKTSQIARKTGARVVLERNQGYGFALRRGLKEAKGDLIILCEPDATFSASDLPELILLTGKYDLVMGTRTNKKYIRDGANMNPLLRFGNITVAKLMQVLYGLNNISDCGCTFRIFKRGILDKILPHLTVGGSHFLPETVVLTKLAGGKIIEAPVHYGKRIGRSKITGSFRKSIKVGVSMLAIILRYKISPPKIRET